MKKHRLYVFALCIITAVLVTGCAESEVSGSASCTGADCEDALAGPSPLRDAPPFLGGGESPSSGVPEPVSPVDVESQGGTEDILEDVTVDTSDVLPEADSTVSDVEEIVSTTTGSCEESCGKPWIIDCSCDPLCANAGVCCSDYCDFCDCGGEIGGEGDTGGEGEDEGGSSSCVGNCGGAAPSGCSCSPGCGQSGNCCPDACNACGVCEGEGGGGQTAANSCVGNCGTQAPSGCFCDEGCAAFGDCCGDACAVCDACPGAEQGAGGGYPGRFFVITANMENLPEVDKTPNYCAGDWEDLIYYFGNQTFPPDAVLVQQVSSKIQLDALAVFLQSFTGKPYGSVIANPEPEPWGAAACDYKKTQTNGILYRQDRFELKLDSIKTWFAFEANPDGVCAEGTADRYRGVSADFSDKLAGGQRVAIASVRWGTGGNCATENYEQLHQQLSAYEDSNMLVWGGDLGARDLAEQKDSAEYMPWYAAANESVNGNGSSDYRDAVFRFCEQTSGTGSINKSCLIYSWTLFANDFDDRRRESYLFGRYGKAYGAQTLIYPPVSSVRTISFEDAGASQGSDDDILPYARTRAVGGYFHW